MKILGKNSLSSGILVGLKAFLGSVVVIEIILLIMCIILKLNITQEPKYIIIYLVMVTAIPATIVLYNLIKIFQTFEIKDAFNRKNIKRLKNIWLSFLVTGVIYFFIAILLNFFIPYEKLEYIATYAQICSVFIAFIGILFVFLGLGMVILLEIYKEAIRHKEENDLTI